MSGFFDALKKASDDAGVPMPTIPPVTPAAAAPTAPTPVVTDPVSKESDGLLDAADSVCITPDGWYATEVYDDLADEEH